ncbi:MAG: FMN-binding negative transcriptional regulator [Pseudomonadota bacterium]
MHPNPAFRDETEDRARRFARERGFGVMTVAGPDGVMAAHVPFLLEDRALEAHLVRSNPIARHLRGASAEATLIVSGPDGYISPDWYGEDDKVPTWNYVAVHLIGHLELAPEGTLMGHLERLAAEFEAMLPKMPWTHHKMTSGVMEKMMRQIVPVRMTVTEVQSTFKLNQNRTASARRNAADQLSSGDTPGMETVRLSELMKEAGGSL